MGTLSAVETSELELFAEANRAGVGMLVKKPLARGRARPDTLAWVADQPGVSSVIVGTVNPNHLRENAALVTDPARHP